MARRKNMDMTGEILLGQLSQKQIQALDDGADALKAINELQWMTENVYGKTSGELDMAREEMESVMQHLAAEKADGNLQIAKELLSERGLNHILE